MVMMMAFADCLVSSCTVKGSQGRLLFQVEPDLSPRRSATTPYSVPYVHRLLITGGLVPKTL